MNTTARLIHLTNHSVSATPLCQSLHSVSSTPLCQSLHWPPFSVLHPSLQSRHWPPFSVLHPSLPIPPLASIQCPPPLSANPSTGLHSVSSTPLCQSLHWPPFSVLHPSLPIPPLASTRPTNKIQNTNNNLQSHPQLCPQLHHQPSLKISTKPLSSIIPRPSVLLFPCHLLQDVSCPMELPTPTCPAVS
ncbi:unnamed protein product [Staurois parvus]|uniref:Uncharacterized protein n=1 Tax=Staurois parvus TaxID=386267 RepID=A0ABN9E6R2_9NEOB|nr:unnamed protein product [Staurois parvus]